MKKYTACRKKPVSFNKRLVVWEKVARPSGCARKLVTICQIVTGDGGLALKMGPRESEASAKRTLSSLRDPLHQCTWVQISETRVRKAGSALLIRSIRATTTYI